MQQVNRFSNIQKMIELGDISWSKVRDSGLNNIRVHYTETNRVRSVNGEEFINMCSCSYLGLDRHQKLVEGAIRALDTEKTLLLPTSRIRVGLQIVDEAEALLSELFECRARVTVSCSAASSGMLPLLASGFLTEEKKPLMVFDKHVHFSMAHMKSACGDETEILTIEHNDLEELEAICKKNTDRPVAYVADGAYSMGGFAPVAELEQLQEKYGLYLYFDDSHSLSAYGKNGVGFVRDKLRNFNHRTIIVSSLGKAFGVAGGVVLTAKEAPYEHFVNIFAGPQGWSQTLNVPALGAVVESAKIHMSEELDSLQAKLQSNLDHFDSLHETTDSKNGLPIRIIELYQPEKAIEISRRLFQQGFYTSSVFFPIVAKGRAGLRVMMRSDMSHDDITQFMQATNDIIKDYQ